MKKLLIGLLIAATVFIVFKLYYKFSMSDQVRYYENHRRDTLNTIDKSYTASKVIYRKANDSLQKAIRKKDSQISRQGARKQIIKAKLLVQAKRQTAVGDICKQSEIDSLKSHVISYIALQDSSDYLMESKLGTLTELLIVKDKQINACETDYLLIKTQLERSMKECEGYQQKVWKYDKQIKRKNTVIKIISAIAIVTSGAIGLHIITH